MHDVCFGVPEHAHIDPFHGDMPIDDTGDDDGWGGDAEGDLSEEGRG